MPRWKECDMNELVPLFMESGLLQFGIFSAEAAPYQLNMELLPAYPDILAAVAAQAVPLVTEMSRLVCLPDSLPLGVALALRTQVPLVYSRGSGAAPVHDLVGAYDIGHAAALVVNVFDDQTDHLPFIAGTRQVGLNIQMIVAVVAVGEVESAQVIPVHSLLRLESVIEHLAADGQMPRDHMRVMQQWLNLRQG